VNCAAAAGERSKGASLHSRGVSCTRDGGGAPADAKSGHARPLKVAAGIRAARAV